MKLTSVPWKVRAKTASRPTNPDPIKMQAGDLLEIAGEEGHEPPNEFGGLRATTSG